MVKHIGMQMVVIPFKAMLEILFNGVPRDISIMAVKNVSIKSPQTDVETYSFRSSSPKVFIFLTPDVYTIRQNRQME